MEKRFTDYLKLTEGYKILPPIDADRYPEIDGLEGPFRTLSGAVVYYDPKEGAYYDKDKDMYLSYDEFRVLDTDYSDMRDERDEVKEDFNEFEKISLSDKSKLMKMIDDMGAEWEQLTARTPDGEIIAYMDPVDDDGDRIYYDYYVKSGLMNEGNEFSHELKKARDSGKDEFEVDGKKYPVKENHKDGSELSRIKKLAGIEKGKLSEGEDFGMFSPEGNDIIQNIVQDILNRIDDGKMEASEAEDALMLELEEMSEEENYSEAMDTEVREAALIYLNKGIARMGSRGDIDRLKNLAGL